MIDPVFIENFESLPWKGSEDFASIAEPGKFETGKIEKEYFEKWKFKIFRIDPVTKGASRILWHAPGWDEPNFGYHLHTEEVFRIKGEGKIPDEAYSGGVQYNIVKGGTYIYRPPGWVHNGSSITDCFLFLTNDGPATHLLSTKDMVGKNALYPDDLQKAIGLRGYVRGLDSSLMVWVPWGKSQKVNLISDEETSKISYKLLSKDVSNNAETLLIRYDKGYSLRKGAKTNGEVEIFVLKGDLEIGEKRLGQYGYSFMPAGYDFSSLASTSECVLFVKSSSGSWFHSD